MPKGSQKSDNAPVSDEKDLGGIQRDNAGIIHVDPKDFADDVMIKDDQGQPNSGA